MKYNKKSFDSAVKYYKKNLGSAKGKAFLIVLGMKDEKAYYSLAPLSKAIHDSGGDLYVVVNGGRKLGGFAVLEAVWDVYTDHLNEKKDRKIDVLMDFISEVEKKTKGDFEKIFIPPEFRLIAGKNGFEGSIDMDYKAGWFKKHKWKKLIETADIVWEQVINLRKKEKVGVGFALVPAKNNLDLPLEDYLDNFAICRAMAESARRKCKKVRMGASSPRYSMLEKSERVSDLSSTLLGCELDKNIDEKIFNKFKRLSKLLRVDRIEVADANFAISGKGYPGKHLFGEKIGYPSKNKKTRWNSPGQMIYQLDFFPQTSQEDRPPLSRVAFTETLPIDVFIKTCNINWIDMKKRDDEIIKLINKSEKVIVKGNKAVNGFLTDFEIGLIAESGKRRWPRGSDVETRSLINKEFFKMTGIEAGTMANLPGGEMFVTPEYTRGIIVGDVVISIDRSYMIPKNNPLIVRAFGKRYKILKGPKKIIKAFEKKRRESWKRIKEQEKNCSVPKEVTEMKKKNFHMIGEFAINTNPKADLTNYLIVNEKIARMIHIALGSGFDADRATEYHTDIVVNAPRQKIDIYGVDKKDRKLWILKKGKFVV